MTTTHSRLPGLLPAVVAVTMALAVAVAMAGCRKAHEGVPEAAVGRAPGAARVAAAADGTTSVALPPGFPTDIYLPAQHRVATAVDMAGMQMVNLVTPAPSAAVYAEADRLMQGRGWKRELAMQSDDGSTLAFHKEHRQVFYQLVRDDAGGTQLAVRVAASD